MKNGSQDNCFRYFKGSADENSEPENQFLTVKDILARYGPPDWIGTKQTLLGLKTQWFYQLGAGKIRYVFFVDDQLIWDWIITEEKMLEVVYPDNELIL
ncbi:MAG: hypothetical protein N3A72_03780 [bacterium]|nr:hypothetical protein [bacterium]